MPAQLDAQPISLQPTALARFLFPQHVFFKQAALALSLFGLVERAAWRGGVGLVFVLVLVLVRIPVAPVDMRGRHGALV